MAFFMHDKEHRKQNAIIIINLLDVSWCFSVLYAFILYHIPRLFSKILFQLND